MREIHYVNLGRCDAAICQTACNGVAQLAGFRQHPAVGANDGAEATPPFSCQHFHRDARQLSDRALKKLCRIAQANGRQYVERLLGCPPTTPPPI